MNSNITDYINRLETEFEQIVDNVNLYERFFHTKKTNVSDDIIDEINLLLREYKFEISDSSNEEENQKIIEQINILLNVSLAEKENLFNTLERKELPSWSNDLDIIKEGTGLVEYLDQSYTDTSTYNEYKTFLDALDPMELKSEIDDMPKSDLYYSQFTLEDYNKLIEYVKIISFNSYVDNIEYNINCLYEAITIYQIMNAKSQTNIFRQGFILLVTTFDAVITDITKEILSNNFFDFLENTNCKVKTKNYKLSEIISEGGFELFKEKIIDEILRDNYVSGLLKLIYQFNISYFSVNSVDCFNEICEIISRRNIHIHKRGVVDSKYYSDAEGNSFEFQTGEYATITSCYFTRSYDLLVQFVKNFDSVSS